MNTEKKRGITLVDDKAKRQAEAEQAVVEAIVAKNSTSYSSNALVSSSIKNLTINRSWAGGLGIDPWESVNRDVIMIRDVVKRYFTRLFKWEIEGWTSYKVNKFVTKFEHLLFENGELAIVKMPDGDFLPIMYEAKEEDLDYYQYPTLIKAVSEFNDELNGMEFEEGEFVIVRNTSDRKGTIWFVYERLRQVIRALQDVDNASFLKRPKWALGITKDDKIWIDVFNALNSDEPIVPIGTSGLLKDNGIADMSADINVMENIETFKFLFTFMLKMLGLNVNDGMVKAERQTELELTQAQEFGNLLIEDMFIERECIEEELANMGLKMRLTKTEESAHDDEKNKVNGEENKNLMNQDEKGGDDDNE